MNYYGDIESLCPERDISPRMRDRRSGLDQARGYTMKRQFQFMLFSLIAFLIFACLPSFAHHGNSAYDEQSRVTIKGTVTEFVWANPHCQIYLDVTDEKGKVAHWGVETNSPGILNRDGWTRSSLKKGDHITMILVIARNGSPIGYVGAGDPGTKVTFDDGHVLDFSEKVQPDQQ